MTWLYTVLLSMLRKYVLAHLSQWIALAWKKLQYSQAVKHDKKELDKAGTDTSLSPEAKAKEVEDAFDKLSDSASNRHN